MATEPENWWARAYRRRWLIGGLLVVALICGWNVWPRTDEPVRIVREYLTAVRDQRVDRALELVDVDSDTDRTLLDAKPLSRDWRVVAVSRADDNNFQTFVDAVIEGPDGMATGTFELMRVDGEWQIQNPFVEVPLRGPLAYLELNGARYPLSELDNRESMPLFPGFYRLYGSTRELLSPSPSSLTLMPEWGEMETPRTIGGTPTRAATREAQRAVEAYLTACTKQTKLLPVDCPFGMDGPYLRTADGYFKDLTKLRWKVARQPELYLVAQEPGFRLVDRDLATAELSAMASDFDGGRRRITVSCPIDVTWLAVAIEKDALTVAPYRPDESAARTHPTCY